MDYSDILNATRLGIAKVYPVIGKGSCRTVFDAGDFVIKCSTNGEHGIFQNNKELDVYTKMKNNMNILCPVHAISDNGDILIMKKALPLSRTSKLPDMEKQTIKEFRKQLRLTQRFYHSKQNTIETRKFEWCDYGAFTEEEIKYFKKSQLFRNLVTLIHWHDILDGDCFRLDAWGYLNKNFVLMDYGCTFDLADRMVYGNNNVRKIT